MTKQILLYLPVIHAGNEALVERHHAADELLIMGQSFSQLCPAVGRDNQALEPVRLLRYFSIFFRGLIRVVEVADLPQVLWADQLVLADEAISRVLIARYNLATRYQLLIEPTFLSHDRPWSQSQPPDDPKVAITSARRHRQYLELALSQSRFSSDWWRRVGAVAVRGNEILLEAYNYHLPSEYSPYINGDPRDSFSRGVRPDLSTASHAEATLIAQAAKTGLSLRGTSLYVTTFPCPTCAKLVAAAGFSACYYIAPYAMSDGEQILRRAGVRPIWVDTIGPSS